MPRNRQLNVTLHVGTKDIGETGSPKWVALEGQTGLFGFADSEEGARERLVEIATFTLDTLQARGGRAAVNEYLNRHCVKWSEVLTPGAVLNIVPIDEPVFAYAAS